MPVTGVDYANQAYSYRNSGIPYSQLDCIGFVNQVRTDLGLRSMLNGTNSVWRSNNLTWKGTLQDGYNHWAVSRWDQLPQGILLFRIKSESDPDYNVPPIPQRYYMDGIGNVTHVGVMTGLGQGIMQSGGYGGRGVHESGWQNNYWTHCAIQMNVEYPLSPVDPPDPDPPDPEPPTPPEPFMYIPPWFYCFNKRKELKPRCRKI